MPKAPAVKSAEAKKLSPMDKRFVAEYLIDLHPKRAAIAAGFSVTVAHTKAYQWVSNCQLKPLVYEAVQLALAKREQRTAITADRVLEEMWAIGTADPNELVQYRIGACAHCWGDPTPTVDETLEPQPHGGALKRANAVLGDLANPAKDPNPECERCAGEGVGRAYVADTRSLSPAARKLYAGVKVNRDGSVEVKMHDKAAALLNIGRHLGMFKDKLELTHDVSEEMQAWLNQRS